MMKSSSVPLRWVLALDAVLVALFVASGSVAEPRRRPGAPPPPPPVIPAPPPVAPVPNQFAPPPSVRVPGPVQPSGACTAILVVRQTQGASGCTIDERVTRAPGVLNFPCGGGSATASFGASRFTGSVQNGVVNVSMRTAFRFSDGCDWESVQGIAGDLAAGRLTFVYSESPLPGQSRCARACQAHGDVSVQR